jgi:hypothetical protein
MTESELKELRKDREFMPAYDETIFELPDKRLHDLGFTDDDIQDLVEFMRWHINQHNLAVERKKIIVLFRMRQSKLIVHRKEELLLELESLKTVCV